ncbi:O-methyltransferase [Carnobacterium maltaromaticum]|uniref:O-methyltransferase n=1 Tax=Carnobacterium maltaromaticum TaxID=2751 RepID=UPI00070520DF|nr:O-methyltransferase [Carnobacterium maltaromaticum]MBC9807998.1 methyltransferase domain-containing protein [Carnobacterium maltaromaticum]CRH17059.1 putative O-methyltransferase [Carnobacterium maltaromaticum]
MEELFSAVDAYFIDKLIEKEAIFDQVLANNQKHGLPPHDVSPSQGKFLYLLSKIAKAQRILEIGTLGGYSTIWFAKALPQNGKIISLEFDQTHAKVAQENTKLAGFSDEVDIIVGPAAESLAQLVNENSLPFDLIFIDADKENNPLYLKYAQQLAKSGTIIIGDNVVRNGEVLSTESNDGRILGVRQFVDELATNQKLTSTAIETVGVKGYDGFTISIVE